MGNSSERYFNKAQLLQRKSVETIQSDAASTRFRRVLTASDLIMIGIGEIIGTGIFILGGIAANLYAGPAVILSFMISAIACAMAGLCYSELASIVPSSGSAYSYVYATCGELLAWIIGWDLMIEYLIGAATVAVGWSQYLVALVNSILSEPLGPSWTNAPIKFDLTSGRFLTGNACGDACGIINLPAVMIVTIVTFFLCIGIRESAWFNHIVVSIKLCVVIIFIFTTFFYTDPTNWSPFIPPRTCTGDGACSYGFWGVIKAAQIVFFAYIGADTVSTCAAETKSPKRDVPIGILGSLGICTVLYILVSVNLTGMVSYKDIPIKAPLATVVANIGLWWLSTLISIGGLCGITSVILVSLLGQPRIFYSMAYDGLLPPVFARIHPTFKTPFYPTLLSGVICMVAAAFLPLDLLGDITSAGTLFAFALVSLATGILRYTRPELERPFKVPAGYLVSFLGFVCCLGLIIPTGIATILRVVIWLAIGLLV
ncbi:amino acid permease-associated protein, partial [Blastocladiella britannica]